MHYIGARMYMCVRGGSADPGSTVSQAASRQAGLSHSPPGESCLLCARAVMIVPAGGIAHAHSPSAPHTEPHSFAYTHMRTCMYVNVQHCTQLHGFTHICSKKARSNNARVACIYTAPRACVQSRHTHTHFDF